jgi:hypothetical protein
MPLGSETPTVLGEGMMVAGKRKRPTNQLPDLQDYQMDALNPEGRVKKKRPKPMVESIPTVLEY